MWRVVGVHGTAQEQAAHQQILDNWAAPLRIGLEIAKGPAFPQPTFDIAYYGDLFGSAAERGEPAAKCAISQDVLESTADLTADEVTFIKDIAEETVQGQPDLGDPIGFTPVPTALLSVMRKLSRRFDGPSLVPLFPIMRHVRLYQNDDDLAEGIRNRVLASIDDDCSVLIGHSLGTVIAFETLALNPDLPVHTLITYGAPLSMRTVAASLRGPRRRDQLPLPGRVRRWVNIFDPRDPVCGAGGATRLWPDTKDIEVGNDDEPHSITRYLSKLASGQVISDALSS